MNKKFTIGCILGVVIVIVIAAVIVVGIIFGGRNNMVKKEVAIENAWAQVQNVYQRRLDLVPNLAEAAKSYMQLEKDIFESITEARASINNAENPAEMQAANKDIGAFIDDFKVIVEDTPELRASEVVRDLMVQLEGTENRITVERMRYNESIKEYNTYIKLFPNYFIARWFGFEEKEFFEAEPGAEKAPEIDLEID